MSRAPEPIDPYLRRALLFVGVVNDGGHAPSKREVDSYATKPPPKGPKSLIAGLSAITRMYDPLVDGDDVSSYLIDVGWVVARADGLHLTKLGRSLVLGLGLEGGSQPLVEERGIVLRNDDPARYEELVRYLGSAKAGMLADPYLRADLMPLIAGSTTLDRLLLSTKVSAQDRRLIALTLWRIAGETPDRKLEVRVTDSRTFHDRYLVHESGELDMIGSSVSGLDTHVTAVVPMPSVVQSELKQHVQELWDGADRVEPQGPRETATDAEQPE